MAKTKISQVATARLKDPRFKRGIHTSYIGDPDSGIREDGNNKRLIAQPFIFGRSDNVPREVIEKMKRAGELA